MNRYHLLLAKEEVPKQIYDHAYAAAATDVAAIAAAEADEATAEQNVQEALAALLRRRRTMKMPRPARGALHPRRPRPSPQWQMFKKEQTRCRRSGATESGYAKNLCAGDGRGHEESCRRIECRPRGAVAYRSVGSGMGDGKFQRDTAQTHARGTESRDLELTTTAATYHGHVDSIEGATGPTFSLLPPENATGNYVKIVQRVPVKIVLEPGEKQRPPAPAG